MVTPDVGSIVRAYLEDACGDPEQALQAVVADALADLAEVERRTHQAESLISRGYVRGGPPPLRDATDQATPPQTP